jgi:alpha-galactosidase
MASPLLISGSILKMSNFTLATYLNRNVIAIDQDPLGKQGSRILGSDLSGRLIAPHPPVALPPARRC